MVKAKTSWRVIDRGVNGRPFLWKNRTGRYVMIDIFKTRPDRCYTVLALDSYPVKSSKRKVIGIGCSDQIPDWVEAYKKARRIAIHYMRQHLG